MSNLHHGATKQIRDPKAKADLPLNSSITTQLQDMRITPTSVPPRVFAAPTITEPVPLTLHWGSHVSSKETENLLADIGGGDRIRRMTTRFYEHAFQDKIIDRFIARHADPHGERLGNWIVEKMGGEGDVWTKSRPPNSRTQAHRDAWHSPKREPEKQGRRFKLDDCRIWMRLIFLAAREEGLAEHKPFFSWFIKFIGHFIAVYERTAPPYAHESANWSANPDNIESYIKNGFVMNDVIGVGVYNW